MEINEVTMLFTVISIGIAVWTVLPESRKLDFKFKLSRLDYFVLIFTVLLIHYLLFEDILSEAGIYISFGQWKYGFNKLTAIYLIFIAASIWTFLRLKYAKLALNRAADFKRLFDKLIFEKRYSDLTELIEKHLDSILALPKVTYGEKGDIKILHSITNTLLTSKPYIEYLAINNPFFCIKALEHEEVKHSPFLDIFLKSLIRNPESILYQELIIESANMDEIRTPLIHFLFNDVKTAEKLAVYKPIGDEVLRFLEFDKSISIGYMDKPQQYSDFGKLTCPIYTGIIFFDTMIVQAIQQGIRWHMWLFYFPLFVKQIIENIESKEFYDDGSEEFPTIYHYLIYEILTTNIDWIKNHYENVQDKSDLQTKFKQNDHFNHNGNIMASSVISFSTIIRYVVLSDNFSLRYKSDCLETLFRKIEYIKHNAALNELMIFIKMNVIYGDKSSRTWLEYANKLLESFNDMDHMLRYSFRDYSDEITQAISAHEAEH